MKLFHITATLLLLAYAALADGVQEGQTKPRTDANITGHVVKAGTHKHIPYITVTIKGTTIGTVTDATGHYFLKDIPEGEFIIVATGVGYAPEEHRIRTVGRTTIEVNFDLEEQTFSMDEVVVSSSRNETNKKTSSSIVNVVSGKTFERTASNNLTETMNYQAGLRIENNCSNCGTTQLRINGLEGQYSQILLDSRPIFSSLAGVYGLEQLPVAMIERVEVIRGGGSALFGANAIGGVVNIITKEPLRNTFSLANTTNIIDRHTLDFNTSLNAAFVSDDHKAGVYLFGMIRNRDAYDRNKDGFSDSPKIDSETIGFRGYYKTGMYTKLTAEYHHIHEFRRGGDDLDRPPHEALIAEQLNHRIDGGGLRFDLFSPDYRHRLGLYASGQTVDRGSYFGTDMNPDAYGQTDDKTFVLGSQYTYAFDRAWFAPAELTAGVEFNHNNLHDVITGYGRDMRQVTNVAGGFVQNEWKTDRFNLLVGGRLDKHNMMKNAVFNPRANVRYSPGEQVGLRLSYASGYRAPQAYDEDLHVDAVGGTVSLIELDPALKPEYSHSVSASADLYHNFGRLQTNLLLEGFYTRLNDVFSLVQYGEEEVNGVTYRRLRRENADGAVVTGLNAELKMGIPALFELQLGYTFQKSRYTEPFQWSEDLAPQKKMFRSPDHYGYFTANYVFTRSFNVSLFGNYTGPMLVQHIVSAEDGAGRVTETETEKQVRGFIDVGLKLAYNFSLSAHCNLEVSGGVKNIFDQFQKDLDYGRLKDASYIYGPSLPRLYFVGLKFYM
ncbi:MAG: TonB-dependent receptor [Alistipes sp.]|nr:TonB-dependent receptor [Alistipes sp.]